MFSNARESVSWSAKRQMIILPRVERRFGTNENRNISAVILSRDSHPQNHTVKESTAQNIGFRDNRSREGLDGHAINRA